MTLQLIGFVCEKCGKSTSGYHSEGITPELSICSACNNVPSELELLAFKQYTSPFHYQAGYIFDSKDNMVADEPDKIVQVRGWGKLQYEFPGEAAAAVQDVIGEMIAKALTEYWEKHNAG